MLTHLESKVEGITWPALPTPLGAITLALLYQLEKTQWWSSQDIINFQFQQLANVLTHADRTIPFYHERFRAAGVDPASIKTLDQLGQIPLLSRPQLQQAGTALLSKNVPKSHGKTYTITTSGSTGRPVKVTTTELDSLFWSTCTLRDHQWQKRDLSRKLAAIRYYSDDGAKFPHGINVNTWGTAEHSIMKSSPAAALNINCSIAQQAEWLCRQQPDYLMTYPSNLKALAEYFIATGESLPGLLETRTVGESLSSGVRQVCSEAWHAKLTDMYSCQEVSCIALQCPEHEHYHVQAENLVVEVLDEEDRRCTPGEIGRVVISTLHNFAMPLIRYELGDYAEVGEPCSCGRGLPVLNKILGRQRNMLIYPDGQKRWPIFGINELTKELPIKQLQFVQREIDSIEVRLVTARPLEAKEKTWLVSVVHKQLDYAFRIEIIYLENIPRSKSGKFEDFISEVA